MSKLRLRYMLLAQKFMTKTKRYLNSTLIKNTY